MKIRTITLALIFLMILPTFSILSPQAKAEPDENPLDVAEKAAAWLMDEAIPEGGGYKWKFYTPEGTLFYQSGTSIGAAGIGIFFLSLYEETSDSLYLTYAEGAAQWLIDHAVSEAGGYKWPHGDNDRPNWWLSPNVSGIGEFLLKMYQTTGDSIYLNYANGAAQWLVSMAYWGEPGCFVPYNPPGRYGSQAAHGISPGRETQTATFLLHMYQETGSASYMTIVEGTAEWLINGEDKRIESDGYKWRHNRPYSTIYPIEGMSQIALFFYEIYETFGNIEYLEHANGAMTWLLSQAIMWDDKAKWPDRQGGSRYPILPFTGSYAGVELRVCNLLLVAHSVTADATYLEYAKKHANWVIQNAVTEGGGYKFPRNEGFSQYNAYQNVRVYNFLSWMYDATGEASYSEYANGAFAWIVDNAETSDGGYKWRTLTYFPYYAPWFSSGVAGIGYYLIVAPSPIVSARMNIDPDTLNLKSNGEWITAYIELPSYYDVSDIDITTIMLNGTIPVDPDAPTEVGDYDLDGIPDLMVKFDRTAVRAWLGTEDYGEDTGKFVEVTFVITGEVAGTPFEGADTVIVLLKV